MADTKKVIGKVSLTPKGAYASAATYERLDVICYEGRGYIVMADSIQGVKPEDGANYMLLADKGADGSTPQKGTDYWTAADQQAIVDDVLAALPTWEGGSY